MKNLLFLIAICMIFTFIGCSKEKSKSESETGKTKAAATETNIETTEERVFTTKEDKKANCEAFDIMSSGQYTLKFPAGYSIAILAQNGSNVILMDSEDSLNYVLLTKNGNYKLDVEKHQYTEFISNDITYDWLFFNESNYTFTGVKKVNNEDVYSYKRGKCDLEYHYKDNELKSISWNENNDYGLNLKFDILLISKEISDDLIFEIPEDYTLHAEYEDISFLEIDLEKEGPAVNLNEIISSENLNPASSEYEAEQAGWKIMEMLNKNYSYKDYCFMRFEKYKNNIWKFEFKKKSLLSDNYKFSLNSLYVAFDGSTGKVLTAWKLNFE